MTPLAYRAVSFQELHPSGSFIVVILTQPGTAMLPLKTFDCKIFGANRKNGDKDNDNFSHLTVVDAMASPI